MTYKFVKSMMERTNREVKIPVKFIEVYEEACRRRVGISVEFDESNLELRQHVRDNLLDNKFIFVDPNDVDSIYITQKAIDKYDKLPEEKW
jgi:hypothetical protein